MSISTIFSSGQSGRPGSPSSFQKLAEICTLNHRGHQSIRKSLSPAHLNAYRSSVMKRRGDRITTDDVKQVAVSLLQENYSLPIPFCFLAVLKSKELDEVLTTLLLYLSCFFEYKSLENKPKPLMAVDIITEHQMMAEALAKKEMAQKKLAVCYFSLIMDLEIEQHQHTSYHKGQMSSNSTEWLLHACLYSFFCYVSWVTFGRKDLRDIQEEVGRLLYSDTFNTAVKNRTDRDSGITFASVNGLAKTGEADLQETGCISTFKHRTSHRHPALSSIVNQRSPLMVCLLPTPRERSPHLFLSSRARRQSPLQVEHCDTKALMEELNQQLASVSFGILGKPLRQFSRSTLIPCGEQKNNRDEDSDHEPGSDVNNNSEEHPVVHVRGSRSSFMGPKSTGLARYGSTTHINTRNSAATIEAVTSNTE
ncbi:protein phosphatase 1 regulatory subunit 36 isoform X2 [Siniperca chuatsi]|uniref:protein phosphatase 1 regulatory subunit 36 isoform X2 n=1 Tax=Siniperca chuatsi TaxID=119488 RepID=UPI001CE1E56F|nr:protein phosphatase 1 regulatory subunit 36 isoform X2 [Siniperca chuatsi]XP_044026537.1 protein phosphatase 1 regulatory subunit 36 isoform X2 [Siniperca chuatsi]